MNVTFRLATAADAADIVAVTRAAFAVDPVEPPSGALTETVDQVVTDIETYGAVVGELDEHVVASVRWRGEDGVFWLRRVAVSPAVRRRGIGNRLVGWTHAQVAHDHDVQAFGVGVRRSRPGAGEFWRSLGYTVSVDHDTWQELRRSPPYVADVPDAAAMRTLGERLAGVLAPGDLVVCIGGLGAGKTTFAQGVGAALGVTGVVTSPTFVLAREHRPAPGGRGVSFVHVDAYRLALGPDPMADLDSLDLDTALDDAITVVEWGEGLVESLAASRVEVRVTADVATESRRVVVDAFGPRWVGLQLRDVMAGAAPQVGVATVGDWRI